MNEERVTIRQVARTAGVSIATVSRVFAGASSVSDTLRRRVEEAVDDLGYTPHEVARSLALGRTSVVGILVPNLADPYVCGLVKRILHEAEKVHYRLIVTDTDENGTVEAAMAAGLVQRGDGLIAFSPRSDDEVIESFAGGGKPVVVVNRPVDSPRLSSVVVDGYPAMRELAGHLADLGHRRVAYLRGPARSWQDAERWQAVSTLSERGVEVIPVECGGSLTDGYQAVPVALEAGATALMAFNDLSAFGALGALRELGKRVPEDVSITGFGDVPLTRCLYPTLTGAQGRQSDAGTATWRAMAALLNGERPGNRTVLRAEPVFRDSTAPPPAG
ncbi:MAG TPA: LacI family DNA-binding transcriptional regulator [Mycobacteriales bacterium]|nr:LacI family DNA-binding transcriptional regulator [Mycobacteriales bacterium]